jgi:hypothetical protein
MGNVIVKLRNGIRRCWRWRVTCGLHCVKRCGYYALLRNVLQSVIWLRHRVWITCTPLPSNVGTYLILVPIMHYIGIYTRIAVDMDRRCTKEWHNVNACHIGCTFRGTLRCRDRVIPRMLSMRAQWIGSAVESDRLREAGVECGWLRNFMEVVLTRYESGPLEYCVIKIHSRSSIQRGYSASPEFAFHTHDTWWSRCGALRHHATSTC